MTTLLLAALIIFLIVVSLIPNAEQRERAHRIEMKHKELNK